ncbi:hypothetical protein [Streptomyces olivaceiscleroticus]|uniref:hypothetical protein n=1 Tax=Streptomyces olivaceiscleroticus TaxID=68245 RepID=UPI0031F9D10F
MRSAKALLSVVLAGAVLAGCGSGSSTPAKETGKDGKKGQGGATAEPITEITSPSGYKSREGWQQKLTWLPESAKAVPVAVAPQSDRVAYLTVIDETGYAVQVRNAATGTVEWTGKPWSPPTPLSEVNEASSFQSEEPELPGVTTVHQGDRDYVVAWGHGVRGRDELNSGREVVELEIFPVDASGKNVTPAHRVSVPLKNDDDSDPIVSADPDDLRVRDGGAGLLITWDGYTTYGASVDMETGKVTSYGNGTELGVDCDGDKCPAQVAAVSADGPVAFNDLKGGFEAPGQWSSQDVIPDGASAGPLRADGKRNGEVIGVIGTRLVARWVPEGEDVLDDSIWSVHDTKTGRIQASTACAAPDYDLGNGPDDPVVVASPSGRYVAYGPVLFDTRDRKGTCLAGDESRKSVLIRAIRDDGTAYGSVPSADTEGTVAEVRAADGTVKALPIGTELPLRALKNSGLFVTRNNGAGLLVTGLRSR